MPKTVVTLHLQRPSTNVPWGFVIQGGRDQVGTLEGVWTLDNSNRITNSSGQDKQIIQLSK